MVLGTSPGVLRDVYFAGFPTFKHQLYSGKPNSIRARVFDTPSNNPSMVVKLLPKPTSDDDDVVADALNVDAENINEHIGAAIGLPKLQALAAHLVDKIVYVGWPHLAEAKVISVCDREYECSSNDEQKYDGRRFETQAKSMASQ